MPASNVCYKDDDELQRDIDWKKDDDYKWDNARRSDKEDRLIYKIKEDEEKERNDKFNFWIYIGLIILGIILLVVLIYAIVSLFSKKGDMKSQLTSSTITYQPPSITEQTPSMTNIQQPVKASVTTTPIISSVIAKQPIVTPPSSPPIKRPSIFDKNVESVPKSSSIPFPSVSVSSDNIKRTKSFISSFLSPIIEREIKPPIIQKGGWKKLSKCK